MDSTEAQALTGTAARREGTEQAWTVLGRAETEQTDGGEHWARRNGAGIGGNRAGTGDGQQRREETEQALTVGCTEARRNGR